MKLGKSFVIGAVSFIASAAISLAIFSGKSSLSKQQAGSSEYTITLNSSNAYTSGDTKDIQIDNGGWDVCFKYVSCSASAGNHASIASGGTITNIDHILSINKINVSYSGGTLKYATSLDATNWSEYTTLANGNNDVTGNPYYIKLQATGTVTLASVQYTYSCETNGNTGGTSYVKVTSTSDITDGKYLIVNESAKVAFNGGLTSFDATGNKISVTISSSAIAANSTTNAASFDIKKTNSVYTIKSASGYYIGKADASNGLSASTSTQYTNTLTIEDGSASIKSQGNTYLKYNSNSGQNRFRYYGSGQQVVQLYKLNGSAEVAVITGFLAEDSNANQYTTNSVFDNDNGLVVSLKYSNGTSQPLESGYTCKIYNSLDEEIDKGKAFPAAGTYRLVVSYSTYADKVIALHVTQAPARFQLVTNASDLKSGDQIVIASNTKGKVAGALSGQYLGVVGATFSSNSYNEITSLPESGNIFTLGGNAGAWTLNNENGALGATAERKLAYGSGTTTWSISIAGGNATIQNGTSGYGRFLHNNSDPRFTTYTSSTNSNMLLPQIYKLPGDPVYPTSISLSGSHEVEVGKTTSLTVSYTPLDTNQKNVVWGTENSSVATVSSKGVVTGVAEGTTNITAKAAKESGYTDIVKWSITVNPATIDDYTLLVYMCGSDLESGDGEATNDIAEMLTVDMPAGVNIVIETGGAKSWKKYGISASNNDRYAIENQELVLKERNSKANMSDTSTFASFMEWGLTNYPANQTGVIMWNHGGAMGGCCYDENTEDYLTPAELVAGLNQAFTAVGRTEKLDWIGYDCCLMSVADIATINSDYFDYMIASQESEWGFGWAYHEWLPTLAADTSIEPEDLLPVICDTFVAYTDAYIIGKGYDPDENNDQTLSVLDLSKVDAFVSAFNTYATNLGINSTSKFDKVITAYNSSLRFDIDDNNEYSFGVADMKDFLAKMKNQFSSVDKTTLEAALGDLVIYNKYGGIYSSTKPCGLCVNVVCGSDSYYWGSKSMYPAESTKLSVWRSININYSLEFSDQHA